MYNLGLLLVYAILMWLERIVFFSEQSNLGWMEPTWYNQVVCAILTLKFKIIES